MADIEQRVRIIKRLRSFKFEFKPNSNRNRNGRMDFVRDGNLKGSEDLETFLSLQIHGEDRVSLKMHSNPWPKFYTFSTREHVNVNEALMHVRDYLVSMRKGNRYGG